MHESQSDYDRLIAPIESQMMRTVWRILRDVDEADEALQNALTRIWGKLPQIRLADRPHAFVLKMCADAAYDQLRKRIRHRKRHCDIPQETVSNKESPLERTVSMETESLILQAISDLPRNQAISVMMRIVQGQSYSSIAAALNCGEATVRTHVARGRATLQQLLAELRERAPEDEGRFND